MACASPIAFAVIDDVPALKPLMDAAIRELLKPVLSAAQGRSILRHHGARHPADPRQRPIS
jgi:hypothetical protein